MRRRLAALPALALVAALALPATAASPFPATIDLPDGWRPEGITAGRGTTVFVGSLADGGIWKGDVRTGDGDVFVTGTGDPGAGVDYEAGADRLWVAGGESPEVRVYDATSGELLRTYSFSDVGFLNDVVVTRDAAYITDSNIQQLVVIPLGPGGALPEDGFLLPLSGDIVYDPAQFNANGIVDARGWLILVQSFNGNLFRVDPQTGEAFGIDIPSDSALSGDGLELHGSTLYVVRNFANTVSSLRLGPGLASATLTGSLSADDGFALDIPTTVARQAGRLWAVNARFTTPPGPQTEYWITRLPSRL